MLKIRVIPTLLWKQFGLVKGSQFNNWRRIGSVLPAIRLYNQREVDELVLVDILAHEISNGLDFESIKECAQECFIPFSVGGGITHLEQVQRLLRIGVDKVIINTAAYQHHSFITEIAKKYGTQSVVASVDVRQNEQGKWLCFSHAGKIATNYDVVDWAYQLEDQGAGEILITSIDRDGSMQGYDLSLIEAVVRAVNIPVIAAGGAGTYQHMVDAIVKAGASAVAAGSMFYFTEQTPAGAKAELEKHGIPVRKTYRNP